MPFEHGLPYLESLSPTCALYTYIPSTKQLSKSTKLFAHLTIILLYTGHAGCNDRCMANPSSIIPRADTKRMASLKIAFDGHEYYYYSPPNREHKKTAAKIIASCEKNAKYCLQVGQ